MRRRWDIDIHWLEVNATKGKDHELPDRFEEAAAKALTEGTEEYEGEERGVNALSESSTSKINVSSVTTGIEPASRRKWRGSTSPFRFRRRELLQESK